MKILHILFHPETNSASNFELKIRFSLIAGDLVPIHVEAEVPCVSRESLDAVKRAASADLDNYVFHGCPTSAHGSDPFGVIVQGSQGSPGSGLDQNLRGRGGFRASVASVGVACEERRGIR